MIVSKEHPADARARTIHLTERARFLREAVYEAATATNEEALAFHKGQPSDHIWIATSEIPSPPGLPTDPVRGSDRAGADSPDLHEVGVAFRVDEAISAAGAHLPAVFAAIAPVGVSKG